MSFIEPPRHMPLILRIALFFVERRMDRILLANRILAWYPKAAIGSGIMEALVAHDEPEVPRRLLALIRIFTSITVSCPFCIDMNSKDFRGKGVSDEEILALKGALSLDDVPTLDARERAALRYAECICRTPLAFSPEVIETIRGHFTERGMVIIASTAAQVNFWARLIQSLGVPPAGFSTECPILGLDAHETKGKKNPYCVYKVLCYPTRETLR
jgi:AhpD family alkylhydroperoxidase